MSRWKLSWPLHHLHALALNQTFWGFKFFSLKFSGFLSGGRIFIERKCFNGRKEFYLEKVSYQESGLCQEKRVTSGGKVIYQDLNSRKLALQTGARWWGVWARDATALKMGNICNFIPQIVHWLGQLAKNKVLVKSVLQMVCAEENSKVCFWTPSRSNICLGRTDWANLPS